MEVRRIFIHEGPSTAKSLELITGLPGLTEFAVPSITNWKCLR
jgi:hypothetical protein